MTRHVRPFRFNNIKPLKTDVRVIYIHNCSSYLTENKALVHMNTDQKMLYIDINGIYENHKEHISILWQKHRVSLCYSRWYIYLSPSNTWWKALVHNPYWFNSQDVMGVSPKPCSPTAYVMLVRRRNSEIKQRIRKKWIISKSVKRKVQKSGGIFVNRREEKIENHF
jgi:hypothetical protein